MHKKRKKIRIFDAYTLTFPNLILFLGVEVQSLFEHSWTGFHRWRFLLPELLLHWYLPLILVQTAVKPKYDCYFEQFKFLSLFLHFIWRLGANRRAAEPVQKPLQKPRRHFDGDHVRWRPDPPLFHALLSGAAALPRLRIGQQGQIPHLLHLRQRWWVACFQNRAL